MGQKSHTFSFITQSAFAVYMTQYQLLPYQRTAEVLNERAGPWGLTGPPNAPYGWPPPAGGTSQRDSPRQWPMPTKLACARTVTCTGYTYSAPTGLRLFPSSQTWGRDPGWLRIVDVVRWRTRAWSLVSLPALPMLACLLPCLSSTWA